MKRVIQIFVATLIIAVVGQSCLQAMQGRYLSDLIVQYNSAKSQILSLQQQLNSGGYFNQSSLNQLHAYQAFVDEFSNNLLGGSIGTITNKSSYYYVFGKMNFSNSGTSAHMQVYTSGSEESISPADWIVIPPGETVNVNLAIKDLATVGPQGMYGYYGLIVYTQNPQGLTASGVPSLQNMVQQNLSGTSTNSPFGQMAPNYKNIYSLAGGNFDIDFGGASHEFCISRTADLLPRNHCITPNDLLKTFTQGYVSGQKGYSNVPIFSSSRQVYQQTTGKYQNVITYWPVTWTINLEINPITTTQVAKDGEKSSTTYVMPSISQFVVTGMRTISNEVLQKVKKLSEYQNTMEQAIKSYNDYITKSFSGFNSFNFQRYTTKGYHYIYDQRSVNIPVNQKNSYGRLPVLPTMKNLVNISDALKSKPAGWSDVLWNLAQHLWSDISAEFAKEYVPIHMRTN